MIRVSNSLDPDQARRSVCKIYQQTTLGDKSGKTWRSSPGHVHWNLRVMKQTFCNGGLRSMEYIYRYKNLSMYDVQQPITAMDWVNDRSLCVATSTGMKHELLELLLPDKMLAQEEQGNLKKDRDFRVNAGGFCKNSVTQLKHIPRTRLCVISDEARKGINFWQIGSSETDLMQEIKTVPCKISNSLPVKMAVAEDGDRVSFGSSLNGISFLDVKSYQILQTTDIGNLKTEPVSEIHHRDKDTLLCCTCSGDLNVLDLRSKQVKVNEYQCQGHLASFWTMSNTSNQSNELLLLSSNGEILKKDLRCLDENVERIQTSLHTSKCFECLLVQKGPTKDIFSISGFDGNVYIFKRSTSQDEITEPLFKHEGHVMNQTDHSNSLLVVKHLWHPWQQDLVMSAATDGSLHAWQYQLNGS